MWSVFWGSATLTCGGCGMSSTLLLTTLHGPILISLQIHSTVSEFLVMHALCLLIVYLSVCSHRLCECVLNTCHWQCGSISQRQARNKYTMARAVQFSLLFLFLKRLNALTLGWVSNIFAMTKRLADFPCMQNSTYKARHFLHTRSYITTFVGTPNAHNPYHLVATLTKKQKLHPMPKPYLYNHL